MSYHQLVENQREFWRSGGTRCLKKRKETLNTLKKMLVENKDELNDAIYKDLHRVSTEVDMALAELNTILENLDSWAVTEKVPNPGPQFSKEQGDEMYLVKEPYGVTLFICPWNFPLVTAAPLFAALAAGNTVIVKPSELDPTFSSVFTKLIKKYFDEKLFTSVEGAVAETTELLNERFDYIMYTGNPAVAKIIMTAAAKNLTPVTLELGGKNPVLVEPDADFDLAAQKILFAKSLNCGQICISADYILTTEEVKPKIIAALTKAFDSMAPLKENSQFARIVNERHFDRLSSILQKSKGKIVYQSSEKPSREEKFLPPVVVEVNKDDEFMQQEIFGPLLPIVTIANYEEAERFVIENEKPLGAYIFTNDKEKARRFARNTSSGGVSVNDVMMHAFSSAVPFGGVGHSGLGRVNGKYSFDSFTHEKAVLFRNSVGEGFA